MGPAAAAAARRKLQPDLQSVNDDDAGELAVIAVLGSLMPAPPSPAAQQAAAAAHASEATRRLHRSPSAGGERVAVSVQEDVASDESAAPTRIYRSMSCLPKPPVLKRSLMPLMDGKSGSNRWVVDMEKMLVDADVYALEMARWKKTSIYRVPKWMKDLTNGEAYRPRVVSLGPFHHGEPDLMPMEEHKRRAVLHLVKRSGRPLSEFVAAIEEVIEELQDAYDGLDERWRGVNRGRFVEMMVTDGCFVLEMMRMLAQKKVPDDHAPNDPVFSYYGIRYLWAAFRSDVIMMENQIPLLALQRLEAVWRGTSLGVEEVNNWVLDFLSRPHVEGLDKLGLHPLDVFHKSFCGPRPDVDGWREWEVRMPSAAELSEAGIKFVPSGTASVRDIDYERGVLRMPPMEFHDGTEKIFLNLMAFEWLHPGAGSDVLSYVSFMEKIVDSERDVALLRSGGLLENMMRSDRKVVELLDVLSRLAMMNVTSRLHDVKRKVNVHCSKPWNRWRASFVQNYLSNPWVFISLVAAVILVMATLLQTVYTVAPFYKAGS